MTQVIFEDVNEMDIFDISLSQFLQHREHELCTFKMACQVKCSSFLKNYILRPMLCFTPFDFESKNAYICTSVPCMLFKSIAFYIKYWFYLVSSGHLMK